jgi:hypothetical protein
MLSSIKSIISGVVGWGGATAADNSTAASDSDETSAQEPEKHAEATRPVEKRDYTAAELKQFDGSVPDVAILIAIRGTIFDVSSRKDIYGTAPKSGFHTRFPMFANCCSFFPPENQSHAADPPHCAGQVLGGHTAGWLAARPRGCSPRWPRTPG